MNKESSINSVGIGTIKGLFEFCTVFPMNSTFQSPSRILRTRTDLNYSELPFARPKKPMKDPYTSSLFESPNVNKSNIQNQISASGKRITRKTTALQNEDRIKLDFHSDSDIRPPESPMVFIQNMTESKPDIQNTPTSDPPSPIDDESGCSESMSESSVSSFFTWFSNLPAVPFLLSKLSFLLSIIVLCFWGISDMLWFIPNKLSKTLSLQDLHRLKTALIALLFATLCLMLLFSKNIQLNMWKKNMILDDHIKSNRENKNNNFEGLDPDIRKLMDWGYIDEHLDQQDTLPKSTKASHTELENKVEGSKTQALDSLSNIINHTNQNDQTESKSEPKETKIESQEKEINPIPDITTEKISTSQNTNYQPDEFFNHLRESLNPISQTLILHSKILAKLQQNDISESLKSELLKLNHQSKESIKKDVANQQMYEKLMESNELLKTMMQKFEPKMEELQIKLDEFETYRGNELDQIKIDIADRLNELEGDVLNKVTELFESFKEDTEEKLENSQNNHQHFHDLGPDYSLLSAGAAIDLSYTSESYYQIGSGVPADLLHRSRPESILDPNLVPGNCWAMKGSKGQVKIHLARPVKIQAIIVSHAHEFMLYKDGYKSAPNKISFYPVIQSTTSKTPLTTIDFNPNKSPQIVSIDSNIVAHGVLAVIHSNWGQEKATCIYRIAIHGTEL